MNAPMQPDAPEWLVTLLGEHRMDQYVLRYGAVCACGERIEHASGSDRALHRVHRAHVAAVVWRELYRRMSEVNPDDNMLDALGGDHD